MKCALLPCVSFALLLWAVLPLCLVPDLRAEPVASVEFPSADQAVEVDSGVIYRAGTRLTIPGTTWSFVVPDHWRSTRPDDADMPFLMTDSGQGLGMLFPLRETSREQVRDHLSRPLSLLQGVSFVPAGQEVDTERTLSRPFQGDGLMGRAMAVLGPRDQGVIYFLMGLPEDVTGFEAVLEQLSRSTDFTDIPSKRLEP